ncbi:hypothetical protein PCE1_004561 [Barthelona sp. PCE]
MTQLIPRLLSAVLGMLQEGFVPNKMQIIKDTNELAEATKILRTWTRISLEREIPNILSVLSQVLTLSFNFTRDPSGKKHLGHLKTALLNLFYVVVNLGLCNNAVFEAKPFQLLLQPLLDFAMMANKPKVLHFRCVYALHSLIFNRGGLIGNLTSPIVNLICDLLHPEMDSFMYDIGTQMAVSIILRNISGLVEGRENERINHTYHTENCFKKLCTIIKDPKEFESLDSDRIICVLRAISNTVYDQRRYIDNDTIFKLFEMSFYGTRFSRYGNGSDPQSSTVRLLSLQTITRIVRSMPKKLQQTWTMGRRVCFMPVSNGASKTPVRGSLTYLLLWDECDDVRAQAARVITSLVADSDSFITVARFVENIGELNYVSTAHTIGSVIRELYRTLFKSIVSKRVFKDSGNVVSVIPPSERIIDESLVALATLIHNTSFSTYSNEFYVKVFKRIVKLTKKLPNKYLLRLTECFLSLMRCNVDNQLRSELIHESNLLSYFIHTWKTIPLRKELYGLTIEAMSYYVVRVTQESNEAYDILLNHFTRVIDYFTTNRASKEDLNCLSFTVFALDPLQKQEIPVEVQQSLVRGAVRLLRSSILHDNMAIKQRCLIYLNHITSEEVLYGVFENHKEIEELLFDNVQILNSLFGAASITAGRLVAIVIGHEPVDEVESFVLRVVQELLSTVRSSQLSQAAPALRTINFMLVNDNRDVLFGLHLLVYILDRLLELTNASDTLRHIVARIFGNIIWLLSDEQIEQYFERIVLMVRLIVLTGNPKSIYAGFWSLRQLALYAKEEENDFVKQHVYSQESLNLIESIIQKKTTDKANEYAVMFNMEFPKVIITEQKLSILFEGIKRAPNQDIIQAFCRSFVKFELDFESESRILDSFSVRDVEFVMKEIVKKEFHNEWTLQTVNLVDSMKYMRITCDFSLELQEAINKLKIVDK